MSTHRCTEVVFLRTQEDSAGFNLFPFRGLFGIADFVYMYILSRYSQAL
jgi:hypothetical protein